MRTGLNSPLSRHLQHRTTLCISCNRIFCVSTGTHDELMSLSGGRYRSLVQRQTGADADSNDVGHTATIFVPHEK
jgi:hypothetical protein